MTRNLIAGALIGACTMVATLTTGATRASADPKDCPDSTNSNG